MRTPRIIDVVGFRGRSIVAVDDNLDIHTYTPDDGLATDEEKCLGLKRAVIDHETIPWVRSKLELTTIELDEIRCDARSVLLNYRPKREIARD
jgi:hypothetical protein